MAGILAVVGDSESADATMSPSPREGLQTTISLIAPVPLLVWMLCTTGFFIPLAPVERPAVFHWRLSRVPTDGMACLRDASERFPQGIIAHATVHIIEVCTIIKAVSPPGPNRGPWREGHSAYWVCALLADPIPLGPTLPHMHIIWIGKCLYIDSMW